MCGVLVIILKSFFAPPPILEQHAGQQWQGGLVRMAGNNHSHWCLNLRGAGARRYSEL